VPMEKEHKERHQRMKSREYPRSTRDEYKQKEFDLLDRNWKHARFKFKIPPFHGKADPAAYIEWEENIQLAFNNQHYSEENKVQMATAKFCGHALIWWNQLIRWRRFDGKEPVETWHKLRTLMRREYVPRQYYKEVLQKQRETKLYPSNSVQKQPDIKRSRPSRDIGSSSKKPICSSKEDIKELSQLIMDVEKPLKTTNTARPSIETQHQEPVSTVSELKVAELD
ncbi:uncharacterized protein LOC130505937, partial [Raphanus sativus]|uniref:Uncharacterized protein LOC130505937 n=1 Tax=Raphanus sativus TaxID=3726 RepID=A0A9W3CY45_RAPSA